MHDYLVSHALKNVWCAPKQDMQMRIRPTRLTPYGGVLNSVKVLWRTHRLPETGVRFHVYQIGQLNPGLIGLFAQSDQWLKVSDVCGYESLIVDIYAASGLQMPRTQTWYMVTADRNLIFAVKQQTTIGIDFNNEPLFIRVYSNAYFNSSEANSVDDIVKVEGGPMGSTADVLALQHKYDIDKLRAGACTAFVNGKRVEAITLINTKAGDVAEYVFDGSVRQIVDLNVSTLKTFTSTLDSKFKYVLHPPKNGSLVGINYHDDVDFFLLKTVSGSRFEGVYYHRNADDAIRMLTHRDYSMPVEYVQGFVNTYSGWTNVQQLFVRMQIRKGGMTRALIPEHNRMDELYKLNDAEIINSLVGVTASVPAWKASNLENSDYCRIMRSLASQIDRPLVQSAYGYNAMTKLLADTPRHTRASSGLQVADVPYGLVYNSTSYEYDQDGLLLDFHPNLEGTVYTCAANEARLVEMIAGQGGVRLDESYGEKELLLDPAAEYRMYICPIVDGEPTNAWLDVTGTDAYTVTNNLLTWQVDMDVSYTLVRGNKRFLAQTYNLPMTGGVLRFSLTHDQARGGTVQTWAMQIPMGELDIWLNGRSLIEGLDYFVDFPKVVIVNKEHLLPAPAIKQSVVVRFTGFCKSDLTREPANDFGFVQYGLLSRNNRFDLREDRVVRVMVGGALYHQDELEYSESDSGVLVPDASNGLPYQVKDVVVPLRGLGGGSTYTLRDASKAVDQQVSDYLTLKKPMPTFNTPNVITERYTLYSPFTAALIKALQIGALEDDRIYRQYSDQVIAELCKPYEELLAFDPAMDDKQPDQQFVIVHPHPLLTAVSFNIYHYRFLARAVKLYLGDAVQLTEYVVLAT